MFLDVLVLGATAAEPEQPTVVAATDRTPQLRRSECATRVFGSCVKQVSEEVVEVRRCGQYCVVCVDVDVLAGPRQFVCLVFLSVESSLCHIYDV